jgi:hypothetical protein
MFNFSGPSSGWMICIDRRSDEKRSEKKVSKIYLFNILHEKCLLDCPKTRQKISREKNNERQPANNNEKFLAMFV